MLLPAASSDRDLAKSVAAERESLAAALDRHRALLFRGFDVASEQDLELAVEAFGWDLYQFQIGSTTRTRLTNRIYNANEASPEYPIHFHHELSLREEAPSKLFFFCKEPSPVAGETAIVPSDVVVEKMEERLPAVMKKLAEVGLIHFSKTGKDADANTGVVFNKTWKSFLGTDDKVEALKRAREILSCNSINFLDDGSAEVVYGPLKPVVERGGKRAWFVPILGHTDDRAMVSNVFGDGSAPLPPAVLDAYADILAENCVDIKWHRGDVLLLDNAVVQHARRPGKPPRHLLVSGCGTLPIPATGWLNHSSRPKQEVL
ncbi:Clavaminate synthase-like protein [Platanthera zijinensis]|uniref:Clavaminate synthase-like protein n=1 Tax=Platanthera zijinensis TaxID=2320716 RepID=A0AAP0BV15_9ASPA